MFRQFVSPRGRGWLVLLLVILSGLAAQPARAQTFTLQTVYVDLPDAGSGDLWQASYFVSGGSFDANQGFSVAFSSIFFRTLESPPPPVPDWDLLVLQPDPGLPASGLYDALALINGASLAQPFTVRFLWLGGPGTMPASQPFTINQFDAGGVFLGTLQSGSTLVIPEPATACLLLAGLAAFALRRGARRALALLLLVPALLPATALEEVSVDGYEFVSEQRITRNVFEYTYRLRVRNSFRADARRLENLTGTVTSLAPATVIGDGQVALGTLLVRGQASSSDTFSFRQDRTLPFNPANLRWTFNATVIAPTAPVLSNLTAPTTLPRGSGGVVEFDFADPDGDLDALIVSASNALGAQSTALGADRLALGGTSGRGALPLVTDGLPFGPTSFTAQLRDHTGALSASIPFTVTVTGAASGGSAPAIVALAPEAPSYARPFDQLTQVRPRFLLDFTDPDGDIDRARIVILDPTTLARTVEENAASLGLGGTSGRIALAPFDIRSNFNLGNLVYRIQVTLLDRNGHASATVESSVTITSSGGARYAPNITFADPQTGGPGTTVQLFGSNFNPAFNYQVALNDLPCAVTASTFGGLTVTIPEGAVTGPFVVTDLFGIKTITNFNFTVPSRVALEPTSAAVPVGQTLALEARPATRGDPALTWRVNGVVGGNATFGTISPSGVYTAPASPPKKSLVEVTATLTSEPAVSAMAVLRITPPAPLPGSARILRTAGGAVASEDGRAAIFLPPNALPADAQISLTNLTGNALPPPRLGRRVLGGVRLEPDGTSFSSPVRVLIPLARAYPPGTRLPVVYYTGKKGGYLDEGIEAVVNESGDRALAPLLHFSTPVVDEPVPANPPTTPPTIGGLSPAVLEEGARLPVRLTGNGLSSDLVVEIRDAAGNPTSEIVPDTLFTLGDEAGLTLEVRPLPGFDSGNRTYRLRLVRPNGTFAEASFTVTGLPELIVPAGATVDITDATPRRFSTFVVPADARVRVRGGLLDLTCTGPVIVDGVIDAKGADGAPGLQQSGGAGGATGGRGGMGRSRDNFISPGGPGALFSIDVAPPAHYGQPGNDSLGYSAGLPFQPPARPLDAINRSPGGLGGYPGHNYTPSIFSLIGTIAECVASFGIACPLAIAQLIAEVNDAVDALNGGTNGLRGLAAVNSSPLPSVGGGGGGGGGRIEISITVPLLGDVSFNIIGGGGGAGGEGGSGVRLFTQGHVRLGTPGALIDARGGNGGNGARTGLVERTTTVLFFTVDRTIVSTDSPVSPGGGGGGGRSGQITLAATAGIFTSGPDQLRQGGGRGGLGGVTLLNPQSNTIEDGYRDDPASDAQGTRRVDTRQTIFDPMALASRAVGRSIIRLQSAVTFDGGTRRIDVLGELPTQRRTVFAFYDALSRTYRANVVLFPGFNILDEHELLGPSPSVLPEELRPRILCLVRDSDGDGLSDADEIELGTDPNVVDTDGDGVGDGDEVAFGSNPLLRDTDGDGLSDGAERAAGTNPNSADTDGDGFFDGAEVFLGSNPLSPQSTPATIPPGTLFASSSAANGSFLTLLDPASTTNVGLLGRPNNGLGFGLAFDESTALYTANFDRLAVFHPLSMTSTPVGPFGQDAGTTLRTLTLAFNPADRWLYGIELGPSPDFAQTAQLLRINPLTGAAQRVGPPGTRALHALAFTRDGVLLAAAAGPVATDVLIELNPATGALVRDIGPLGFGPLFGLAISRQDVVYGALPSADNTSRLLTIDASTGAATAGPIVARGLFDLSVYPCLAPCLAAAIVSAPANPPLDTIGLAVGDFDADGNPDVALSAQRSPDDFLEVRPGNGAGSFAPGSRLPLPGTQYTPIGNGLVTADFNADGRSDVVIENDAQTERGFIVYLADSASPTGFGPSNRAAGNALRGLPVVASFNPLDDNRPDIAGRSGTSIALLVNDGTGNFTAGASVNVGSSFGAFTAADMNGDGFPDLVLLPDVFSGNGHVRVYLNDGHGAFPAPPWQLPVGTSVFSTNMIRVADFDGDGRPDVLVLGTFQNGTAMALFRQTAPNAFAPPVYFPYQSFTTVSSWAVGDLTVDGLPDVALFNSGPNFSRVLQIYVGDRDVGLRLVHARTVPGGNGVAIGDFDRDGRNDVVVTGTANGVTALLYFRNEPSF